MKGFIMSHIGKGDGAMKQGSKRYGVEILACLQLMHGKQTVEAYRVDYIYADKVEVQNDMILFLNKDNELLYGIAMKYIIRIFAASCLDGSAIAVD